MVPDGSALVAVESPEVSSSSPLQAATVSAVMHASTARQQRPLERPTGLGAYPARVYRRLVPADVSLTPTSYLVLGLVRMLQPCTSYDLKRVVRLSIGNFWTFPHSQLYAEPARLAVHGLLTEEQEEHGRRRRLYRITASGEAALREWLAVPPHDVGELRDLGLLKLFFGHLAEREHVSAIAAAKRDLHAGRRAALDDVWATAAETATPEQLATLELGRRWNQLAADFWGELAEHPPQRD